MKKALPIKPRGQKPNAQTTGALRILRESNGISPDNLAQKLKISRSGLAKRERQMIGHLSAQNLGIHIGAIDMNAKIKINVNGKVEILSQCLKIIE